MSMVIVIVVGVGCGCRCGWVWGVGTMNKGYYQYCTSSLNIVMVQHAKQNYIGCSALLCVHTVLLPKSRFRTGTRCVHIARVVSAPGTCLALRWHWAETEKLGYGGLRGVVSKSAGGNKRNCMVSAPDIVSIRFWCFRWWRA